MLGAGLPALVGHAGPLRQTKVPGAEVRSIHTRARPVSQLRFIRPAIKRAVRAPTVENRVFEQDPRTCPFDIDSQAAYLNRRRFRQRIRLIIRCAGQTTRTWFLRAVSQSFLDYGSCAHQPAFTEPVCTPSQRRACFSIEFSLRIKTSVALAQSCFEKQPTAQGKRRWAQVLMSKVGFLREQFSS